MIRFSVFKLAFLEKRFMFIYAFILIFNDISLFYSITICD